MGNFYARTHSPPVFMPDEAMSDYYVDQEWRQDPESLPPLRAMEIPFEWAQGWIKNKRTFPRWSWASPAAP